MEVVLLLQTPIPAQGKQGVWRWEPPEWLVEELAARAGEGGAQ